MIGQTDLEDERDPLGLVPDPIGRIAHYLTYPCEVHDPSDNVIITSFCGVRRIAVRNGVVRAAI